MLQTFAPMTTHRIDRGLFLSVNRLYVNALYTGALGWVAFSAAPAAAQEMCVTCSGPAATYRCTVEKSEKLATFGAAGDRILQLVCAKELARSDRHESCSARREAPAQCLGELREIPLASVIEAASAAAPKQAPVAPVPPAAPAAPPVPAADPKDAPPRTMLELAKRTGETSKKQLEKVGTAAERTWDCITSLFSRC
jgi:hypothetical protein